MIIIGSYAEKGGVGKSTTAIGLSAEAMHRGLRVGLIDLDPRATATTWCDVELAGPGLHVGAIMAESDPTGWAEDIAVDVPWSRDESGAARIKIIPADRNLSRREAETSEYPEAQLRAAIEGWSWQPDLIVIDMPNRPGGPLVRAGLGLAQRVVYVATADEDGADGVRDAVSTVRAFRRTPWNPGIQDAGIVICRWSPVPSRDARRVVAELGDDQDLPPVLQPAIPDRVIVREARAACEWWGTYPAGQVVTDAYRDIYNHVAC